MSAPEIWAAGATAAVILLVLVCLGWLFRAVRNEHIIARATAAMHAALTDEPAPQRSLLAKVADTLAAQERAAARIQLAVRGLVPGETELPEPEKLLRELLDLPEPQLLITDFFAKYAGSPDSEAAFASVAAGLLRAGIIKVYGGRAGDCGAELEQLLVLAGEGRISAVALSGAGSGLGQNPASGQAPRVTDLDAAAISTIARALQATTRRQLRLASLLHGQAEAIMRLRQPEHRGPAALWARLTLFVRFPPIGRPAFRPTDLAELVIAFDAVGEVMDTAAEQLSRGEPLPAAHLLAGVRVPVPVGLPGRIYHQEALAQVRPLAALAVWHRLAVCHWAGLALQALAPSGNGLLAYSAQVPAGRPAPQMRNGCDS
jgi:hypothetical protein